MKDSGFLQWVCLFYTVFIGLDHLLTRLPRTTAQIPPPMPHKKRAFGNLYIPIGNYDISAKYIDK